MKWKNKLFRYALSVFVVLLFLNPETVQFAIFLDAVGLDIFLMLLEVQILAILGTVLFNYIDPIRSYFFVIYRRITQRSGSRFQEQPQVLLLFVPCQATVMHMLVFSAVIASVINM
jgi:hypothetical protein